jgi:hypothetical protein
MVIVRHDKTVPAKMYSMKIVGKRIDNTGALADTRVEINKEPDSCPICQRGVKPIQHLALCDKRKGYSDENSLKALQIIYRCPKEDCSNLFIAYYSPTSSIYDEFMFVNCLPYTPTLNTFSNEIQAISPIFQEVYNQAAIAESQNLMQICGPGYRKALEFLIKDYLIKLEPESKAEIETESLAVSINTRVTNSKIRSVSERAVWLGNDETHFVRKWSNKDLSDLKKLILATMHWIEQEELAKDILIDMPSIKSSKGTIKNKT